LTKPCGLCGNNSFEKMFDLGVVPLGFPVEPKEIETREIWREKLELERCDRCFLVRTVSELPPESTVSENFYLSGFSQIVSDHDRWFSQDIPELLALDKNSLILEIGCGDGSLLNSFQDRGFNNLIGIEPAIHSKLDYPFEVVVDFFNADVVSRLKANNKQPDLIVSNHVLDCVGAVGEFFDNLRELMKEGSYFVMEVPYVNNILKNFRVDVFAHVTCSWYTANAIIAAFNKANLELVSLEVDLDYRGGSFIAIGKKQDSVSSLKPEFKEWQEREKEELSGDRFVDFRERLNELRVEIRTKIQELLNEGITIYGYGAGIKTSTILNWLGLGNKEIGIIGDRDPNKRGKIIPVVNIPVRPVEELLSQNEPIAVIILAIDHVKEIEATLLKELKPGSTIIHLLPEFKIVSL